MKVLFYILLIFSFIFSQDELSPRFHSLDGIEQKIIDLGLQFENMLESIECNKPPLNSFEEAWENFIVISAIEKSLREGRVISIN